MDISQIGLFSLAERRLAWTDKRQTMLAENIANANTPNWRPRDVTPFAALVAGRENQIAPAQTAAGHMAGRPSALTSARQSGGERAPDGNGVRMDVELSKVADTETAHQLTTDLYMKYLSFFRSALGR